MDFEYVTGFMMSQFFSTCMYISDKELESIGLINTTGGSLGVIW